MKQKLHGSNYERETLRIFWSTIWSNRLFFLKSLCHSVGIVGINVAVPLLVSITLAGLATRHGDVGPYIVPLIIAATLGVIFNWYGFDNLLKLQAKTQNDLMELTLRTLLKRSVGFHTNTIGGKLVSNAIDYINAFDKLINTIYSNLLPFTLTMLAGMVVVLSRSLPMGLALMGVVTVTILMTVFESRRRAFRRIERKKVRNKTIAHMSDTIVNAQAVKTFASEERELRAHRGLSSALLKLQYQDWSAAARSGSIRMAILLALQIAFIAYVGHLIQRDVSVLAAGIFSFSYMITLTGRLFEVGNMIRNIEEAFLSAASMTEIMLEQVEIVDAPNAQKLVVKKGKLDLNNVTFAYHDDSSNGNVFENLTLKIPAGQKIGIVGPSGGGKSTLTRLFLRFDDVDRGAIIIDGQDIKKVTQASLRQAISYVPQEPLLFHRTILENIAYGQPDATEEDVRRAAKLAFADDFIQKLPHGYDTVVGERGVKLSGGQRQRVAIARAILKDAPILILDEATSALDSESEVYIQRALETLMKDRTTIVIAHRLSTIQKMDRVVVLDNGTIIEDDTHQNLLKSGGLYARLWAHQSDGFIED